MISVLVALIQNAALLLAMMVVLDLISSRKAMRDQLLQQFTAGLILGGLCLGLMHSAFRLETGIIFDTRSVLLSLSGLFFGVIPTALAMAMAAGFRLWQGGAGAWTGVSAILAMGGIGILWRHRRRRHLPHIKAGELYGFGVLAHLVMLGLMLTLPGGAAWRVLGWIALPVMLIYPVATVALGRLLASRLSRENATGLLTASEELFRGLFQKHAAVKLLIDPDDGRIVDANEAAEAFYGWPLQALRRMNISEINTLPAEQVEAEMAKTRKNERVYFEFKHRLADGSVRDVAVYSSRIHSAGKELLHSIVHDITQGRRAEEALRESEAYQRQILHTSADGFWVLDDTGRVLEANDAYCAMSGYSREELLGMSINDLDAEEQAEETRERIGRIIRDGSEIFETTHRRKDGSVFPVEISTSYLKERGGQLVCFCRDLTRRRKAEEALKREHVMLARTEAATHVGSWEWEAEGDQVTWSDELFRIFGLEPSDEAPPFAEHQAFYVPEDRTRLTQAVDECVTNGIPYDLEVRVRRSDGALRHCVVRGFPERDTDGVVKRLYGSLQDVTEIRRAEERITTLSRMLDDAPASITIHDTEGRFVFVNAATASLHGYESVREFMEINLHDLDVPESEALIADRMQEIAEEGEARFEVDHHRKDGSTFPLAVLAKRIEWEGRPAILSVASSVAERRIAEEQLSRSYDLLRNLAALVPGVIYQYRLFPDGRSCFPYSSPGMWKIYEVSPEEVEQDATPVFGRLHPEDADRVSEAIFASARTLETFYCEFRVVLPEQGLRWRWSQAEPQRTDDGGTLWHGIILDVTDRKQAEEALRAAERRNQSLLDHSPACHKIVDLDFNLQYMSRNGYRMLKLDENADIYEKPYPFGFFPAVVQTQMKDGLERVKAARETVTVEALASDIEGNGVWLHSTLVPVLDDGGNLEHITVVSTDLTEQRRLENDFRQAQKMESVGRLAGGVAHDFNNMLSVILGHADLALDELSEDSPLRDDLDEIRKAAERSANLTRQLLAFARRQTVAPKVLDLNETIASMLKMLERLIGEDIDLLWKPSTRLDLVHIDPGQVDQILANLTVNARDAIGHANGRVTIETANVCFDEDYRAAHADSLSGDYVMLAVSDDGCGMDEETRAQIFEPFFTTKGMGEGTGLGLSTIYGIVKQNKGFVNVYSEPGEGATFRVYLPALEADSRRHGDVRPSDAPAAGGSETILVVEDEAAILNLTRTMLERLGYTVLTAGTPTEALRMAREQQANIDLLITDVVMPEMNGRDLARNLHECSPHIRCLFMSGYTANVIAHQGVLDDGVNFIQKPFSPRDLARKVSEALRS